MDSVHTKEEAVKKKTKTPTKIKLNTETIRLLNPADLAKVAGGLSNWSCLSKCIE